MVGPHVLSLFSGIGGLELAVRAVFPWARVVGYVERDAFAASILMARMEEKTLECAPVWVGCIEDLDGFELRGQVDLITAGFPCTDLSQAGRREGIEGEASGLWGHVARFAEETRAPWLFLENVAAIRSARGRGLGDDAEGSVRALGTVLADLAALGFNAEWLSLRASDVGAPHERDRWFCLAHRDIDGRGVEQFRSVFDGERTSHWNDPDPCGEAVADRRRERLQGVEPGGAATAAVGRGSGATVADPGDGQFPQPERRPEGRAGARPAEPVLADTGSERAGRTGWESDRTGHEPGRRRATLADTADDHRGPGERRAEAGAREDGERGRRPAGGGGALADPGGDGDQRRGEPGDLRRATPRDAGEGLQRERGRAGADGRSSTFPPGPGDRDAWAGILADSPWLAPAVESGLCRVVDGIPRFVDASRSDRLRCLGNAVVPLQAAAALAELLRRMRHE